MSDPAAPTPPAEPTTPPAGDPPAAPPTTPATPPADPATGDPAGDPPAAKTVEQLEAELAATRREAAKYRTKAREQEEAAEAARLAELSEAERLKEEKAALEQQLAERDVAARTARAEAAIVAAATTNRFADPADAVAFVASQVEYDEHGAPTNVDTLVQALAASKPHLVATAPGAHGGNPARPGGGGSTQTDAQKLADILSPSGADGWWSGGGVG